FANWCLSHARAGAASEARLPLAPQVSAYALQHLSKHLAEIDAPVEDWLAVTQECWRNAWIVREGSSVGFSEEVRCVLSEIRKRFGQQLSGQLRCALILSSLKDTTSEIPPSLVICATEKRAIPFGEAVRWARNHIVQDGDTTTSSVRQF